tara:strand:+ start:11492 stop:12475 length:984 start_codon:yes stop_codon:yes gene_type:complete
MKSILFVGLGSIGQRHLINAMKIFNDYEFYALRETNHNLIIKETKLIKKRSLQKEFKIKEVFRKTKDALNLKPNIVFVCNPTSKHLDTCIAFSKIGSHIFVEKPLGSDLNKYKKLKKLVDKNKLITFIGYQTRFHPGIKFMKNVLKNNKYGKVISSNFTCTTYLPNHHTYEDYKKSYVSIKKLGGGTSLNLSHEIDLIYYFFGMPKKVICYKNNPAIIRTETENDVHATLFYKDRSIVKLELSYSSFYEKRNIEIKFEKTTLKFDLLSGVMKIFMKNKIIVKSFVINRNELFVRELKHFKNLIMKKSKINNLSIPNHKDVFKLIRKL